ncbi:MAG: zinc ribbon domain-containing protein [Acidobacteria bacterium]|nr:zinc ribbon domain-containing protein [Acidobacteriota bacterium]
MPIYEYSCRKCGEHFEIMQRISDKPLARHAQCGGKLEKEWSQTSFQLKGSGWYVTDYSGRKSEAKEGEAKEGKESKESKDTKVEATQTKADGVEKPDTKKSDGKKATKAPATASTGTAKSGD